MLWLTLRYLQSLEEATFKCPVFGYLNPIEWPISKFSISHPKILNNRRQKLYSKLYSLSAVGGSIGKLMVSSLVELNKVEPGKEKYGLSGHDGKV